MADPVRCRHLAGYCSHVAYRDKTLRMTQVFAGTSGYSFKAWKGGFYPAKLPDKQLLPHYAGRLATVELNNTFYRTPTPEAIAGWCNAVPPEFRFSVKAPQRITHVSRLKDASLLAPFADLLAGFGERLGVVLFQFPPHFRLTIERLHAFRSAWPRAIPTALEFRHPSWDIAEVREWMRREGLAWVVNDSDDATEEGEAERGSAEPTVDSVALASAAAGGVSYVRLRRARYSDAHLQAWADALVSLEGRAFVFFKHEVQGPGYAVDLRRLTS